MNAGDPFLFATSKIPIAVRGLTKKEAADSTGRDWSRTQVPGKHDVAVFEKLFGFYCCWVLLVVSYWLLVHLWWCTGAGNGASAAPVLSLQPISCFDLLCFAPCFLFICRLICWLRNNYTVHIEKQGFHHLVPKVTAMLTPKISKSENISSVHWLIALAAKIWK